MKQLGQVKGNSQSSKNLSIRKEQKRNERRIMILRKGGEIRCRN